MLLPKAKIPNEFTHLGEFKMLANEQGKVGSIREKWKINQRKGNAESANHS